MKITMHMPHQFEADVEMLSSTDTVELTPKFYQKNGWMRLLYLTSTDKKGNVEKYTLNIHAKTKKMEIVHLKEVLPECDTESV